MNLESNSELTQAKIKIHQSHEQIEETLHQLVNKVDSRLKKPLVLLSLVLVTGIFLGKVLRIALNERLQKPF